MLTEIRSRDASVSVCVCVCLCAIRTIITSCQVQCEGRSDWVGVLSGAVLVSLFVS